MRRRSAPNLRRLRPSRSPKRGKGGRLPDSYRRSFVSPRAHCWGVTRGASKGDSTMPQQKDFKRLVRARMKKTGEAYTAARAQLIRKPKPGSAPRDMRPSATVANTLSALEPKEFATIAGMSDEK